MKYGLFQLTVVFKSFGLILLYNSSLDNFINGNNVCPTVICNDDDAGVNGVCLENYISNDKKTIRLSKCPPNQSCNYNSDFKGPYSNYTCKSVDITVFSGLDRGNLVDRDYCIENKDCASKQCIDGICAGFSEGHFCTNTTQCDAETYCDLTLRQCKNRKNLNEPCNKDHDEECLNLAGCFNGTCTTLFSLPENTTVTSLNDQRFCHSDFVTNNSNVLKCEDLINDGLPPFFCRIHTADGGKSCQYRSSISNQIIRNDWCYCNLNGNGFAYCSYGTNSNEYNNWIISILLQYRYKCHFYNKDRCSSTPYDAVVSVDKNYAIANQIKRIIKGDCFQAAPNISINPANCASQDCIPEITKLIAPASLGNYIYLIGSFCFILSLLILL